MSALPLTFKDSNRCTAPMLQRQQARASNPNGNGVQTGVPVEIQPYVKSAAIVPVPGRCRSGYRDSAALQPGVTTASGQTYYYALRRVVQVHEPEFREVPVNAPPAGRAATTRVTVRMSRASARVATGRSMQPDGTKYTPR